MVKDNVGPIQYAISIATVGSDLDASVLLFTPPESGTIDRDFVDVTAAGIIYCYDSGSDSVLIQLNVDDSLSFEARSGMNCLVSKMFFSGAKLTFIR